MAGKSTADFIGFIHNVSPVKTAKNGHTVFFNAKLQTDDSTYQPIVCYDPNKHSTFKDFQNDKSPVKITSKRHAGSISVNENTKIAKTTSFFPHHAPNDESNKLSNINDVHKLATNSHVNIHAKLLSMSTPEMQTMANNNTLRRVSCIVADHTGYMKLTAWGSSVDTLKISTSYKFSHVTVRIFNSEHYLNINIGSSFEPIDDLQNVVTTKTHVSEITGEVVAADVTTSSTCCGCKSKLAVNDTCTNTIRCTTCNLKQKIANANSKLFAKILVKTADKTTHQLISFHHALEQYLMINDKDTTMSPSDIEDMLLDEIELTFSLDVDGKTVQEIDSKSLPDL
jgi:hypothetical protein